MNFIMIASKHNQISFIPLLKYISSLNAYLSLFDPRLPNPTSIFHFIKKKVISDDYRPSYFLPMVLNIVINIILFMLILNSPLTKT